MRTRHREKRTFRFQRRSGRMTRALIS